MREKTEKTKDSACIDCGEHLTQNEDILCFKCLTKDDGFYEDCHVEYTNS